VGEIAFAEFRGIGQKGDIAATVDANVKALHNVDAAFRPVIQGTEIRWAMAGLARLSDANAKFAAFLRGLTLPANLSPADQAAVKGALEAQAAQADKESADLRALCTKEAKKNQLLSEAAKSCLLNEPLPDTITMYSSATAQGGKEPASAAPLHKTLLKNARDVGTLAKLAEIHMSAGDPGAALLLLERAAAIAPSGTVENLRGLTLYQMNEPQEAGEAFQKAVQLEPGNQSFHLNLAAHYAAFGQIDLARAELRKAGTPPPAPRGPTDHPDVGLLGRLDEKKGKGDK
jgi:Flp pilus assembly protein TadD